MLKDTRPSKGREVFVVRAKWIDGFFCDECYEYIKERCIELGQRFYPKPDDKEFYAPTGFLNYKCPHRGNVRVMKSSYEGIK